MHEPHSSTDMLHEIMHLRAQIDEQLSRPNQDRLPVFVATLIASLKTMTQDLQNKDFNDAIWAMEMFVKLNHEPAFMIAMGIADFTLAMRAKLYAQERRQSMPKIEDFSDDFLH